MRPNIPPFIPMSMKPRVLDYPVGRRGANNETARKISAGKQSFALAESSRYKTVSSLTLCSKIL